MKVSMVMVAAAAVLSACATEGALAPVTPALVIATDGNPPPPRVLGSFSTLFNTSSGQFGRAQQFVFRGQAYYNRNLTTGVHLFEMATGPGRIRANASGVIVASGIVVLVDPGTGAQVTFDLGQLVGYSGPLFGTCPVGAPANCLVFTATLSGMIQPASGPAVPATGQLRFRWDSE